MLRRRLDGVGHGGTEAVLLAAGGGVGLLHGRGIAALDDGHHLAAGDGLLLQQVRHHAVHVRAVLADDLHRVLIGLIKDALDFLIHDRGGVLRAIQAVAALKILAADAAQRHHAEGVAHAVHGDHVARDGRGLLDILGGAVGHGVHHHFLRRAAAHRHRDLRHQLVAGAQIGLVLLGHQQGVAEAALGVRDDGDLLHGLGIFLLVGDHGMADLVIGHKLLFKLGEHAVFLLAAGDDELKRGQHILLRDELAPLAHGAQGGFVREVGKVRAHAARRGQRDLFEVHVLGQLDIARVHLQRGDAPGKVGPVDGDAAVETAGAQQRLVQHLGPVGRRQDDHALAGIKAVHLGQQLVERLLALVVAAEAAAVTGFADGIDLVDEDDARGDLCRLGEQVAHAGRAHAHEHLHKVRAGDGEKRHLRLAGDRLGQQRLARTGRADQQRALGDLRADGGVLFGVVQKIDDLLQRLLGLVLTGHVVERDAGGTLHIHLGVRLAHRADAADAAQAAVSGKQAHHQHKEAHHQQQRQHILHHDIAQHRHLGLVGLGVLHIVLVQKREQRLIPVGDDGGVERVVLVVGLAVLVGVDKALRRGDREDLVPEFHGRYLPLAHQILELAVGDLMRGLRRAGLADHGGDIVKGNDQNQRPQHQRDPAARRAALLAVGVRSVFVVLFHSFPSFRDTAHPRRL